MIFVFLWLTSLGMIISRSIHVKAGGIISFFLWLNNIPLYIHTTPFFFFFFWSSVAACSNLWSLKWKCSTLTTGQPGNSQYIFIHSTIPRHSGCFHVLAIVNRDAMNYVGCYVGCYMGCIYLFYYGFLHKSRSGIAGWYGSTLRIILFM